MKVDFIILSIVDENSLDGYVTVNANNILYMERIDTDHTSDKQTTMIEFMGGTRLRVLDEPKNIVAMANGLLRKRGDIKVVDTSDDIDDL